MTQVVDAPSGVAADEPAKEAAAGPVDREAHGCPALGSALYSALLLRTAADVRAGRPAWAVLSGRRRIRAARCSACA